ncbi:chemotaxis response regulator protein-glutamate methylesterase [Paenibacillaceae bacterium]|nr:chemotaxis response regulator protein-glutamate methylesterase [Paenibacillaceae bacterium]
MTPYRVLVVDDSAFMRRLISDLIVRNPKFIIAATATTGTEALEALTKYKPDVITLDLEMPEMNGLEALKKIMEMRPTPVIMLSGISEDGTRETIKALQFGAFDFIRKPSGGIAQGFDEVARQLQEKLLLAVATGRRHELWRLPVQQEPAPAPSRPLAPLREPLVKPAGELIRGINAPVPTVGPAKSAKEAKVRESKETQAAKADSKAKSPVVPPSSAVRPSLQPSEGRAASDQPVKPLTRSSQPLTDVVAVGTSTGGPRALHQLITGLPADFPAAVLVVQHMPPRFTKSLAARLDTFSKLQVVEAVQGESVNRGVVYIAPGGFHMTLVKELGGYSIRLSVEEPRHGHRPSVDVLFESLLPCNQLRRHVVQMTGMGSDGAAGMKALADDHCLETAIAESEETSVVYGMPRAAIECGAASTVLPLHQIASHLVQSVLKHTK